MKSICLNRCRVAPLVGALLATSVAFPFSSGNAQSFEVKAESRQKVRGAKGRAKFYGSFAAPSIADNGAVNFFSTIYGRRVDRRTNKAICAVAPYRLAKILIQTGNDIGQDKFGNRVVFNALTETPVITPSGKSIWTGTYYGNVSEESYIITTMSNAKGKRRFYRATTRFYSTGNDIDVNRKNRVVALGEYEVRDETGQLTLEATIGSYSFKKFRPVIGVGETPIGFPLGVSYTTFGIPMIDDNDYVYYVADISDTKINFDGIWRGKNADPSPLITVNTSVPVVGGGSSTVTLKSFADSPSPSPNGQIVAFAAGTTEGSPNSGIWTINTSTLEVTPVAYTSTRVEGAALSNYQPPSVNDSGVVAFMAQPSGSNLPKALYVANGTAVTKIIANGDTITLNGVQKKVIDVLFNPRGGLNSKGQVAFEASFDDRSSAIIVATP